MQPSEIIKKDAERNGYDAQGVINTVGMMLKNKVATLMQSGNTLLVLRKLDNGGAELHLFTADSPLAMSKALKHFIGIIRRTQLNRVYGKVDNQEVLQLLKRLGVDVQDSDLPEYNWMAPV